MVFETFGVKFKISYRKCISIYMKVTKKIEHDIVEHYKKGLKISDIAKLFGFATSTICICLKRNNINTSRVKIDKQIIIDLYNDGYSICKISKKINYTNPTILRLLKENNIPIRHSSDYKGLNKQKEIWNKIGEIKYYYEHDKKTSAEIGNIYNVSSVFICNILRENNIDIRKPSDSRKIITERDIDIEKIANLYKEGHSSDFLSKKFNISKSVIFNRLKGLNIESHGTTLLSYKNKIKNSFKCKIYTLPSGLNIYIQGYEPKFLDFIFHQKLLSELEILSKPPTFIYHDIKGNRRKYFPDFYIPKFNLVVEIKSSWIMNKQTPENFQLKKQSVLDAGFDFICILDNNFEEMKEKYFKDEIP